MDLFGKNKLEKISQDINHHMKEIGVVINGLHIDMVKYKKEFSINSKNLKSHFEKHKNDINKEIEGVREIKVSLNKDLQTFNESRDYLLEKVESTNSMIANFENNFNSFNSSVENINEKIVKFNISFNDFIKISDRQNILFKRFKLITYIFLSLNFLFLFFIIFMLIKLK